MGGLAYDLETQFLPQYQNWDDILFNSGAITNNAVLQEMWQDIVPFDNVGNNISEVIIRGTRFANDWYYIWGSYKGAFNDLRGDGLSVVAWDGFVTCIPAHALFSRFPENFPGTAFDDFDFNDPNIFGVFNAFYSIPMRLPWKLNPGAIADNAAIAADSEVGVHTLDYALGVSDAKAAAPIPGFPGRQITDSPQTAPNLSFVWMGHQRTVAANGTLDMDYIGCGGYINVQVILPTYASPDGTTLDSPEALDFIVEEDWGWSRNTAACINGAIPLTNTQAFPKPESISILQDRTANWERNGTLNIADSLLRNLALPAVTTSGYYVSRIYDSSAYNTSINSDGISLICGEASRINAAGTAVAGTVPFVGLFKSVFSSIVELNYDNSTPTPRATLKIAVPPNFIPDTSLAAYDYEGAWANVIAPSLSQQVSEEALNLPNAVRPTFLVGINNLDIGGVKTCAILAGETELCIFGDGYETFDALGNVVDTYMVFPYAIKGNAFTTNTNIVLPEGTGAKWTGRAQQQATFSPEYERNCKGQEEYEQYLKGLSPDLPGFGFIVDPDLERDLVRDATISPEDRKVSSLVGCSPIFSFGPNFNPDFIYGTGNIFLGGLSNRPYPTIPNPYSNLGYGLLAFVPGGEPYVFMYDYGTVSVEANFVAGGVISPALPTATVRGSGLQEGDNMNAAFTVAPTSTTRYPISASWDNDRDQWIFTFADATNGFGFMSVNSAFSTAENENQFTFLDQTDNFALPAVLSATNPQVSLYTSRMMTPILDGLTVVGQSNDLTAKGQRAVSSIQITDGGGVTTPNFGLFTINGTTGRTANVWVDYLLFDGVDSLIATELQTMGLRVTVENVEWYKAKIIRKGEIGFTPEEVEDWVRSQQEEYKATQRLKQRQGRSRLRKRQVQAWQEGNNDMEDIVSGDFTENGGFDSLKEFDAAAADYLPPPEESSPDSSRKEKNKSGKR